MTSPHDTRSERRLLWLLAAVELTLLLDFMILMPLGPELMGGLRISPAQFGGLVSSYTLASAACGVSGGVWLDKLDRKRTLLGLYAVFVVSTLACGAAPNFLALLGARILAGCAAGLTWAVIMATVVDVVPPERRGSAMGIIMTSYALAAVAGVPFGLMLAGYFGWPAPFFALTAAAGVLWALAARLVPRTPTTDESPSQKSTPGMAALFSRQNTLGWALTFCVVFAGFLLIPYLGTFMVENLGVSQKELGWVYLCGGVATFFTQRGIGSLVDRFGPKVLLAVLLPATVVPHLLFTHLSSVSLVTVLCAFVLFMTLTSGRIIPTMTLVTEHVAPRLRGRYMAVNTAAADGASGLAAWTSGLLLAEGSDGRLLGFERSGLLAVLVTALALCVLWLFARSGTPEADAAASDALGEAAP
jgi:predicted MFS family arabinose efflux permease